MQRQNTINTCQIVCLFISHIPTTRLDAVRHRLTGFVTGLQATAATKSVYLYLRLSLVLEPASRATQSVVWRVRRGGRLRFSVHASNPPRRPSPPSLSLGAFGGALSSLEKKLFGRPTNGLLHQPILEPQSHFQGYFGPFCTTRSHRADCVALTLTRSGSRPREPGNLDTSIPGYLASLPPVLISLKPHTISTRLHPAPFAP